MARRLHLLCIALAALAASFLFAEAENICNETPPATRFVDGIPAYAQCSTSTGAVYSNNGIDTRTSSGGSDWIRTQYDGGYQCTELIHRYLAFRWNIKSVPNGNAGEWCDAKLPTGLEKADTPVHGDFIVFGPGSCGASASTGHVAIIDSVKDSVLVIVEQNNASRRKCKVSCARCFLHASANSGTVDVQCMVARSVQSASPFTILHRRNTVTVTLSAFYATGATIRVFTLQGRCLADLSGTVRDGKLSFRASAGGGPLILSVEKDGRTVCSRVLP